MFCVFRLKKLLLFGAAFVLGAALFTVAGPMFSSAAGEGVALPVVMYHAVIDDGARLGKYVISPAELEDDFRWLKAHGYTPVLSDDLISYVDTGAPLPAKPILLSFDDGYLNNYRYAFEAAKRHGMKFVLAPIGRWADFYTENPDDSPYYAHATWEMLREMEDSGLVEIGNHTYDLHKSDGPRVGTKRLPGESDAAYEALLKTDIGRMQTRMKEELGHEARLFAYPFGAVSKGEAAIIERLGFRVTLSCEARTSTVTREPQNLYFLGRYLRPSGVSSEAFFSKFLSE